MPNTPPTISNTEIIRTQVFDIQPSFPVDAIWRLMHDFMLPRPLRSVCLRAAFYMRHNPCSIFSEMAAATKKPGDEPGFCACGVVGRGAYVIGRIFALCLV